MRASPHESATTEERTLDVSWGYAGKSTSGSVVWEAPAEAVEPCVEGGCARGSSMSGCELATSLEASSSMRCRSFGEGVGSTLREGLVEVSDSDMRSTAWVTIFLTSSSLSRSSINTLHGKDLINRVAHTLMTLTDNDSAAHSLSGRMGFPSLRQSTV